MQNPIAFCFSAWCPGGLTAQNALLNFIFSTPSIAEIIDPTASFVASLLPGEIIVSPSRKLNPELGKDFLTSKENPIDPTVKIYWAAVEKNMKDNLLYTNGGRVASVVAYGDSLYESIISVYNNIYKIDYNGVFYRRDIGYNYLEKKYKNP